MVIRLVTRLFQWVKKRVCYLSMSDGIATEILVLLKAPRSFGTISAKSWIPENVVFGVFTEQNASVVIILTIRMEEEKFEDTKGVIGSRKSKIPKG